MSFTVVGTSEVPQGHPLGSVFETQGFGPGRCLCAESSALLSSAIEGKPHRTKVLCFFLEMGICRYNIFTWSEQVSDFIEEMIQSEVILNLGIEDDYAECRWSTLQWMSKETIAAANCSSSRKDLMTIFLEQLKYQ